MSVLNNGPMNGYNQFQPPPAQGGNPFLNFLQSNGGSSLVGGVLGGLGNFGAQRSNERMSEQQLALQREMMNAQNQRAGMDDRFNRDLAFTQAAPTGWEQGYQQQQLLKNMALQRLMNGSSLMPTNPAVQAKLGANGQPFKPSIPEEWQTVNPFGVNQTMSALGTRQGALDQLSQGRGPGLDFSQFGIDPARAQQLNQQTGDYRRYQSSMPSPSGNPLQEAINMNRPGVQPQRPSVMGGAMSGAMTGASMGSVIPGLGTAVGGGIGALVGAGRAMGGPRLDSYGQQFAQNGGNREQFSQNMMNWMQQNQGGPQGFDQIRAMLAQAGQQPAQPQLRGPQAQNPYARFNI